MTKYNFVKATFDNPGDIDKIEDYGTKRLELKELVNKLLDGGIIVIPHFEQSLGGDVFVKLSDNKYPQTMISMYNNNGRPTGWKKYAINLDALSVFPCYEYTQNQAIVGDSIEALSAGTVIRYKDNETDKIKTTMIDKVWFLPGNFSYPTTQAPGTNPVDPDSNYPNKVVTGSTSYINPNGKNTVLMADGTQQRLDYRFDNSMGGYITNINMGYQNESKEISDELDKHSIKSVGEGVLDLNNAEGTILYTVDSEKGYFCIVATPDPIIPDSGDTITLEG